MSPEPPKIPSSLSDILGQLPPKQDAYNFAAEFLRSISSPPPAPAPPTIEDRWFKDQSINIDGYTFVRCRFDRCKLVTERATFAFRNCYLDPQTGLFFNGAALKLVRLLIHALVQRGRITLLPNEMGLLPTTHPDSTFTLE